ncbi:MAG TPA: metallophosphoesterase [Acidobacteriaceae bacterium]|nr:metallophosphoesterase [Acidobacteriaceae bacterium]
MAAGKKTPGKRAVEKRRRRGSPLKGTAGNGPKGPGGGGNAPQFGEPAPSPDPTGFQRPVRDSGDYSRVDAHLLQRVPPPRGGGPEPKLTLDEILGSAGAAKITAIQQSGQIVFHAAGDTGSVKGPASQSQVADKMVNDFTEDDPADAPSFLFHLGDVVYNFGEAQYYYDQFYEPYREYPAPIIAIPGNHDGEVYAGEGVATLAAFLRNFCSQTPEHTPEAGALVRTSMIAPGVFFTLEAPFVRILGLYSNVLEDPGVISSEGRSSSPVSDQQLNFLTAALERSKSFSGAVLVAVHHPPFTYGTSHSGSPRMLEDLDTAAKNAGFWPHAYLSGHAHNYQRYTREVAGLKIPYLVAGNGGHALAKLQKTAGGGALRTPIKVTPALTLENYDDLHYGYLRIVVDSEKLRIEYHPSSDGAGAKTPDDVVTVNLKTRAVT